MKPWLKAAILYRFFLGFASQKTACAAIPCVESGMIRYQISPQLSD
tara:strand:- start:5 stop:142 length:138 start_codon:yes stop_codon:yes gene_type:complete